MGFEGHWGAGKQELSAFCSEVTVELVAAEVLGRC